MDTTLKIRDLTCCILQHIEDIDETVTLTPIATGKFNSSYFVSAGERELVLRVAPPRDSVFLFYERNMIRQEQQIHQLVREYTSCPVPEIIVCDTSQKILPRDFIIMERLPGMPLSEFNRVPLQEVLYQVGMYLAQVHKVTEERYGYLGDHHPMEPQENWAEAFRIMWSKLLADIEATGIYSIKEGDELRALLDKQLAVFDRPVMSCLLHMDVWAQNILVNSSGQVTALLDWDRALWGDMEIEFAVLDYCGVSEPSFWKGYGKERDQSPDARLRNIFYLLYELQKYIVIRHGRSHDTQSALSYKNQAMNIVQRYLKR